MSFAASSSLSARALVAFRAAAATSRRGAPRARCAPASALATRPRLVADAYLHIPYPPPARAWLTRPSSPLPLHPSRAHIRFTPRASDSPDVKTATPPPASPPVSGGGRFKRRDPNAAPPAPSPLGSGPGDPAARTSGIKVVPVEQRSRDAFQGVAKVDPDEPRPVRLAKLVAGDAFAILLFAAVGRSNHGESLDQVSDVLATAAPFLIGWFATAPFTGAFGDAAIGTKPGEAAVTAAKGWIVGVPAGLLARAVAKGAPPPGPFVAVAFTTLGAALIGWRAWFASSAGKKGTGNKKGNPLEFMSLLMSLTKRW